MAKRKITTNPAQGLFNKDPEPEPAVSAASTSAPAPHITPEAVTPTPIPQIVPEETSIGQSPQLVVSLQQREARSQRKQILLQPSVHDRAETKCKRLGISMNEAVNQLLAKWIDMD